MGVTGLWPIIEPIKTRKSLSHLEGQTVAIDLSIWLCATQHLKLVQPVPHLRNLFFRLLRILSFGIKPVIVLDGEPPDMKQKTILKRKMYRNASNHKDTVGTVTGGSTCPSSSQHTIRSEFSLNEKQCCQMLDILGIPFIRSIGEAEAMCALLNQHKIVDACITDDGDAFLFGAQTVYRNFSMEHNCGAVVESYSMKDIEQVLSLSRESLVALALLIGCDYLPQGVPGVGRVLAMKMLDDLKDQDILKRIKEWCEGLLDDDQEKAASTLFDRSAGSSEVKVRRLITQMAAFPCADVINEFMVTKDKVPSEAFAWKTPRIGDFLMFAQSSIQWNSARAWKNIIKWLIALELNTIDAKLHNNIVPHSILRRRVENKKECFEIQWYKLDTDAVTVGPYYTSVECADKFTHRYSQMTALFRQSQTPVKRRQNVPHLGSPRKKRKSGNHDEKQISLTKFFSVRKSTSNI